MKRSKKHIIERYDVRDSSGNKVDIVKNPEKVRDEDVSVAILVYGKTLAKFGLRLTAATTFNRILIFRGCRTKITKWV